MRGRVCSSPASAIRRTGVPVCSKKRHKCGGLKREREERKMASAPGLRRLPSLSSQASSVDVVAGGPTTDFATFDEIDADLSLR